MGNPYKPPEASNDLSDLVAADHHALKVLIECLHLSGALDTGRYRQRLREIWDQMPPEDAGGLAGQVFEELISQTNALCDGSQMTERFNG